MSDPESGGPAGPRPDSAPPSGPGADKTVSATTAASGFVGPGRPVLEGLDHLGPYRIVRPLGGGGMGQVYEAIHGESGHRLAIKILPPDVLRTESARERFLREGTLAASINHPHSLYVYGTEEIDGLPLIAMELAPGGTLKDRIDAEGPLDPSEVAGIALQIVDGLAAAAACRILHRDVKPSNCFVDRDGSVKVGDYGLSISTTEEEATQLTATGVFLGTPAYASPEQIRGGNVDERSDIYSVGSTLYYLVSGQRPFAERTGLQLMASILEKEPVSLRQIRADVPKRLAAVILRCLRKDPAERFADYAELRRALAPLARAGEPAGPRDRFLAGFVDSLVIALPITLFTTFVGGMAYAQDAVSPRGFWIDAVATLAIALVYGSLLEGLWGITVGKALFGLRVADDESGPPGVPTAFVRSLLYLAPRTVLAIAAAWLMTLDLRIAASVLSASVGFALLIPFVTARKSNGYEAIHDGLTRTRVLAARPYSERPKLAAVASVEPVRSGAHIGPFEVAQVAATSGAVLEGYDPSLRRRVWIHVVSPETPAVTETRRDVSRGGRLRWLNGRRADGDSWDAFEAVGGRPFPEVARAGHPWSVVRFWLRDLAEELRAAEEDGTLPSLPEDDRIWITEGGRAMLLEFPGPGPESGPLDPARGPAPIDAQAVQAFLARFARRALTGDSGGEGNPKPTTTPVPLFARRFLEQLEVTSFPSVEETWSGIESVFRRAPTLGRGRRALSLVIAALVPMFAVITLVAMKGIFEYVWTEHREAQLLEIASSELRRLSDAEEPTEQEAARLAALEIYVAGPARHAMPEPEVMFAGTPVRRFLFQPDEEEWLMEFWDNHEPPTDGELAAATESLRPFFRERDEPFARLSPAQLFATFGVLAISAAGVFVAPFALLLGTLFRGGAVLKLFGIAVVGADGAPAGRARAFLRTLIAWLPALGLAFSLRGSLRAVIRSGEPAGELQLALAVLFVAGVVWALVTPPRGLQDRAAGTWLVPR